MFSCNQPSAFLAEWPESFTCYSSNTEIKRYRNKSQHGKLTLEKEKKKGGGGGGGGGKKKKEEKNPTAPTGTPARDLSITSPAL